MGGILESKVEDVASKNSRTVVKSIQINRNKLADCPNIKHPKTNRYVYTIYFTYHLSGFLLYAQIFDVFIRLQVN